MVMRRHLSVNLPLSVQLVSSAIVPVRSSMTSSAMMSQKTETPPVAKKVEHKMELLGDVRVDDYYWLRDDSRSDPDVLSYLQQENDYTNFHMSGTKKFEQELYSEIRGRMIFLHLSEKDTTTTIPGP
ncbi:hypothetical protein ACLB2K_036070 [Fragaria x ananassa]